MAITLPTSYQPVQILSAKLLFQGPFNSFHVIPHAVFTSQQQPQFDSFLLQVCTVDHPTVVHM